MKAYTETGIVGYPSAATAEKGRVLLESLCASFADHLEVLLSESS